MKKYASDLEIAERYKIGRATVWRWVREQQFPKPVQLSPGCTRWDLDAIDRWEADRKQEARA